MTDKTHQIIGFTVATATVLTLEPSVHFTWPILGSLAIGSLVGSFAPDIDQPTGQLWDDIPLGGIFGRLTSYTLGGHRNLSHSILGLALFYLLVSWLIDYVPAVDWLSPHYLFIGAIIGFMAHLAADSITVMGIPILWPFGGNMGFPPRPFHGARIVTGKWFENLVILPGTFVLLVLLIWANISQFCPLAPALC